jgi:lycopene beta-cyclase
MIWIIFLSIIFNDTISLKSQKSMKFKNKLFMSSKYDYNVDVAVIGGGIAGTAISWLLQEQQNCKVAMIDSRANSTAAWYPNYGEWRDEWHALSERLKLPELKQCTTTEWERTDCFFGGSFDIDTDERLVLSRPYIRVDRVKLQAVLRERFDKRGGVAIASKLSSRLVAPNLFDKHLIHDIDGSTLTLDSGETVRCKVLVDASGFESKLTGRESPMYARSSSISYSTGYQIAYGFIAHVTSLGPYDLKAMTLFDYRWVS